MTTKKKQLQQLERTRKWRKANSAKVREYKQRWRKANPERHAQSVARRNRRVRLRKYQLIASEFESRRILQGNCCPICTAPFIDTPAIDHCHVHGHVRGLLCRACNLALGFLKDNPASLERALIYLRTLSAPRIHDLPWPPRWLGWAEDRSTTGQPGPLPRRQPFDLARFSKFLTDHPPGA